MTREFLLFELKLRFTNQSDVLRLPGIMGHGGEFKLDQLHTLSPRNNHRNYTPCVRSVRSLSIRVILELPLQTREN